MNRKLQGEIDRVLKKVTEGVEEFESILEKATNATSPNHKEKYEADLKKEIKKLQRSRDALKTWLASNEVKAKGPLTEARKLIETQMERFRSFEKEAKTKAYSKEGLTKKPKEDAKTKTRKWIKNCLSELSKQTDGFESELERLRTKKETEDGDLEKTISLEISLERHQYHQKALEKILRLLDNSELSVEQVDGIKSAVCDYVNNNQKDDFYEDEEVYERELGLDIPAEEVEPSETKPLEADDLPDAPLTITNNDAPPPPSPQQKRNAKSKSRSGSHSRSISPPLQQAASSTKSTKPPAPPSKQNAREPKALPPEAQSEVQLQSSPEEQEHPASSQASPKPAMSTQEASQKIDPFTNALLSKDKTSMESQSAASSTQLPQKRLDLPVSQASSAPTPQPQRLQPRPAATKSEKTDAVSMLHAAFQHLPESRENERMPSYLPQSPAAVPDYYPQEPLNLLDNIPMFEKFDTDTLFFIFYYQQGTYQQYLAAKELKNQSWRFHKKYLTWFQRHEEPKEITNDYEQGTYVYFDYEAGWCQRKKTEFTFEYRYLEDGE